MPLELRTQELWNFLSCPFGILKPWCEKEAKLASLRERPLGKSKLANSQHQLPSTPVRLSRAMRELVSTVPDGFTLLSQWLAHHVCWPWLLADDLSLWFTSLWIKQPHLRSYAPAPSHTARREAVSKMMDFKPDAIMVCMRLWGVGGIISRDCKCFLCEMNMKYCD